MKMQTLGFDKGFRYMTDGRDIYRNDYADPETVGVRFYSTINGFENYFKVWGNGALGDDIGEDIDGAALMGALRNLDRIRRGLQGWHRDAEPLALADLRRICRRF